MLLPEAPRPAHCRTDRLRRFSCGRTRQVLAARPSRLAQPELIAVALQRLYASIKWDLLTLVDPELPPLPDSPNRLPDPAHTPDPARTLVLVPARMASTRLPGKPLAEIGGAPMIVQVARRAREAAAGRVVVAADDAAIVRAVEQDGGEAVMTRDDHESGSDRIWEAATLVDPEASARFIVNLQGDLPTIPPDLVRQSLVPLADAGVDIATLAAVIDDDAERDDPNVVKIVGSPLGGRRLRALYFTRATAPWGEGPLYHHVGIYAYRREALERFVALPPSALERRERLEQLRALEAGLRIDAMIVDSVPPGVDTQADLDKVRAAFA